MKNFSVIGVVMVACVLFACGVKEHHESDNDEWAEMESFHLLMAEAYHPFKDASNLLPAKNLADTLAIESEKWAGAAIPASLDKDEMKPKLVRLSEDCKILAGLVKQGASDEKIGGALTKSHDSFHAVMESWHRKGKEKH